MDLGIAGRKALVNGGSTGLGSSIALALAREGAEVFITARGAARLHETCTTIADQTGSKVQAIVADHTTNEGRAAVLAACPDPDIFVATFASPSFPADFSASSFEELQDTVAVGLLSQIEYIKAFSTRMVERRWGRIVNITTGVAEFPAEVREIVGPPRLALENYCQTVSLELAAHNVTVNSVLPGLHLTQGVEQTLRHCAIVGRRTFEEEASTLLDAARVPAGRFGKSSDLAAMVAMLCSDYAGYVTGQSLLVDGGLCAAYSKGLQRRQR